MDSDTVERLAEAAYDAHIAKERAAALATHTVFTDLFTDPHDQKRSYGALDEVTKGIWRRKVRRDAGLPVPPLEDVV